MNALSQTKPNTLPPTTGQDLKTLGDVGPYELVKGKLILTSPAGHEHGIYEGNFYFALRTFVQTHQLGKVQVGEVGIYTGRDPDTVRGADVLFISNERYAQQDTSGFLTLPLTLSWRFCHLMTVGRK